MDYFPCITPTDPYRVGRYEDSYRLGSVRGPEGIIVERREKIG